MIGKVSQYKHYVSLANLIRVIRLDCIAYTIEQVNATDYSLFKCPFPALSNRVGQIGDRSQHIAQCHSQNKVPELLNLYHLQVK